MNMLSYIFQNCLVLALLFLFYRLVMSRTTLFRLNRIFLLFSMLACMIFPFFKVDSAWIMEEIQIPVVVLPAALVANDVPDLAKPGLPVLWVVYLAGFALILTIKAAQFHRVHSIIESGGRVDVGFCRVTLVDSGIPSFSFGRHVVMSSEDYADFPVIMKHELAHVRLHHSADIVFTSAVSVLAWFNPFVWLVQAELKRVHEYEADNEVVAQGADAVQYQMLLLRKAAGEQAFNFVNGFNRPNIKTRIEMLQSSRTSRFAGLGYIACVPILLFTVCFCNNGSVADNSSEKSDAVTVSGDYTPIPYLEVDTKPVFKSEDVKTFSQWVSLNVNYPQSAIDAGIEGWVTVCFVINEDASLSDIEIQEGLCEEIDREVIRVIQNAPALWTPGKRAGKPVKCYVEMPVVFKLRK